MTFEERKALRLALLKDVYDNYFNSGGKGLEIDKGKFEKETETYLGYNYLANKRFIEIKQAPARTVNISPTVLGIDLIENSDKIKQ